MAIHTGHSGFYTDWRNYEVDQLIESLKQDKGERVSYPLLDVNVKFKSGDVVRYAALNEATLRKVNGTLYAKCIMASYLKTSVEMGFVWQHQLGQQVLASLLEEPLFIRVQK